MNYAKVVDDSMEFISRVRENVLTSIPADQLAAVHDDEPEAQGSHYVELGDFVLVPVTTSLGVFLNNGRLQWSLELIRNIPGRFNPRDGGTPPDVEEIDLGNFDSLSAALAKIAEVKAIEQIDAIGEEMMYDQMDRDMEAANEACLQVQLERQEKEARCIHGKQFHCCRLCLIAAGR